MLLVASRSRPLRELAASRRLTSALAVAGVAAGIGLRVYCLRSRLGYLDGDEAVTGLMARHFLHGELRTFFWGQSYGGTAEIFLTAGVFAVFGQSVVALRLVPLALYALACVLLWRVGRRTVGEPRATLAACLLWCSPAYFVWKSTRAHDFYGSLLVLALTALLVALRVREHGRARDLVLFGGTLGLGFWSSPEIVLVGLPLALWLGLRRPDLLRRSWLVAAAFVAGVAPWLVANAREGWPSRHLGARFPSSFWHRLGSFFTTTLPQALGFRVPFSLEWLPAPVVGAALAALAATVAVVLLARNRRELEPLALVALPYPFLYALDSFSWYDREPRYLLLLAPVLALALARLGRTVVSASVVLAAALGLSAAGLVAMRGSELLTPYAPDAPMPTRFAPLLRALDRAHVRRAYANYWIAFPVTFLTDERIVVAPTNSDRYPPYARLVGPPARAASVVVAASRWPRPGGRPVRADGFLLYPRRPERKDAASPARR